jgi:heme oxygenase (biliverdin-producing, ferredoxin)
MNLKEATKNKHMEAENHRFVKYLFAGSITDEVYSDYLYNQYIAYKAIEERAESCGMLEGIEKIKRTNRILKDFQELGAEKLPTIYVSTMIYVNYVKKMPEESIIAHLYVRHFGDMFGGQMIKKLVPGSGSMYEFEDKNVLINNIRSRLSLDLADEANKVFDFAIRLFEDLANEYDIR